MCEMNRYRCLADQETNDRCTKSFWSARRGAAWVWPMLAFGVVVAVSTLAAPPYSGRVSASTMAWLNRERTQDPRTVPDQDQDQDDAETADEEIEPGREVRLLMQDGRSFRGEFVLEDRLNVVIKIAGIATTFDRLKVIRITALKTFEEQYHELEMGISREDYFRRFEFCQWLYRRKKYELAAGQLESLLDDTDEYPEARALLRKVNNASAILGPDGSVKRSESEEGKSGGDDEAEMSGRFIEAALLNDAQINLLRIYEVDLKDPPRMLVSRETIDRLFDRYAGSDLVPKTSAGRRQFYVREPVEILELMFELQARDLYGEIRVLSEPDAFIRFRRDVQRTWLTNSCATSKCHGGSEAGDFYLFNKRTNFSRTVYTNFLILEQTRVNGEALIDYGQPAESPLLHMGLLRNQTARPHPEVPGWRPVFRSRADPIFQKAVDWINSMYRPRPDYPFKYELPTTGLAAGKGVPIAYSDESAREEEADIVNDGETDKSGGAGR